MVLQAIKYKRGELQILDQLKLPYQEDFLDISSPQDAWNAIKKMQVRGAPAIAIVAALSVAVWLQRENYIVNDSDPDQQNDLVRSLREKLDFLVASRPTAVNLSDAAWKLKNVVLASSQQSGANARSIAEAYIAAAEQMLVSDVEDNENIGRHGAAWLLRSTNTGGPQKSISILTHCNTGPYNQGCRLTGYELIHDQIPATLITDSMAAALLRLKGKSQNIAAIVVGADRVAANGDTANKIGTYGLAILARHHGVKFLVAAPRTTIDLQTKSGEEIVIEERPQIEVTTIKGPPVKRSHPTSVEVQVGVAEEISIAAANTKAWNPAFDVTPAELIDGIVTELGVIEKEAGKFNLRALFPPAIDEK